MIWDKYKEHVNKAVEYLELVYTATEKDQIEYYLYKADTYIDKAVKAWKDGLK